MINQIQIGCPEKYFSGHFLFSKKYFINFYINIEVDRFIKAFLQQLEKNIRS